MRYSRRGRGRGARAERLAHTDDWLITYADTITLLLCLFAVLLSITTTRKEAGDKAASRAIIEQAAILPEPVFPPVIMEGNLPLHGLAYADEPTADMAELLPAPEAAPAPVSNVVTLRVPAAPAPAPVGAPASEQAPVTADSISSPAIADRARSEGTSISEQSGERVRTVEIGSTAFFAAGAATLSATGKAILQDVATKLRSPPFASEQITVEGHTDDAPISSAQFPSNWELSTARAAAVVHFFLEQGIPASRLRAAGYADTFPVAPNRDLDDKPIPENQARNRRVVIKLERTELAKHVM